MPPDALTTVQLLGELNNRFERVERAILGDDSIGHLGLVKRTEMLEVLGRDAQIVHDGIDARRIGGDKRTHERIDGVFVELARVEKKIDRLLWAFAGAGAVAGGSIAGFARLIGG